MVPYVRKSFRKHYIDGLRYIELGDLYYNESTDGSHLKFLDIKNQYSDDIDIQDEKYMKYSKAYQYAMDQTRKEIHQAVEGMYHNLNTLQSRSGN